MAVDNINNILGKLDELRAVFVIGQRAVPFIEEILHFFKEMSPLLDEIAVSIRDSTSKIPRATSQIQNVTKATELATTEILDLVDSVLLKIVRIKSYRDQISVGLDAISQVDNRMIRLLRSELKQDAELLAKIEMLHNEKKMIRKSLTVKAQTEAAALDEIRDSVNRIMMALQVQDITTQQLAAVKHLFESIRDRLAALIRKLNSGDFEHPTDFLFGPNQNLTFDPNATFDRSGAKQQAADAVMHNFHSNSGFSADNGRAGGSSDSGPAADVVLSFSSNGSAAPAQEASSAVADQSEIDQLFATAPVTSSQASQDEIDKLFKGGF